MKISEIFKDKKEKEVLINGWITSNRGNDKIRFITINDGSNFNGIQVVVKKNANKGDIRVGSAIYVKGVVKLTPEALQPLEVQVEEFKILKEVEEEYPIQQQKMTLETLRELPHLRNRTNTFRAVMRIRSTLTLAIHEFFNSKGFLNIAAPIITSNDGEGAGEAFVIDSEEKEFFNTKATLGVTGQLHAEAMANGLGLVYTFAPTFRAENSHTQRHLAEFWMVEPEMAFYDKNDAIKVADELIRFSIKKVLEINEDEINFLDLRNEGLKKRLNSYLKNGIKTMTYTKAIEELKKVSDNFDVKDIHFGIDLATEHEKYISEVIAKGPIAITDYPKEIKAFYMKQNKDGKTVGAFDVLAPGIGEIIGGSERENDIEKLEKRIKEMGINQEDIQWYIDLRRFGAASSSGFGLGFERLVMYVTGMENIRDVIPFPRTPNKLMM